MTVAQQADQTAAGSGLNLELTRYFEAAPERVFDAWLNDQWGKWLPPFGSTARVTEMNPSQDGEYAVAMTMPDNRQIEIRGRYVEIDRPHKLVMTWVGNYDGHETILTVLLRKEGSGTWLTLRQEGFAEQQLQQGYARGWSGEGGSFDKLAQLLSS